VLMDVMMPVMDGLAATRELRKDPRWNTLPVLMLTAKGQPRDREAAERAGADHFLAKPFANSDILAAVRALATRVRP